MNAGLLCAIHDAAIYEVWNRKLEEGYDPGWDYRMTVNENDQLYQEWTHEKLILREEESADPSYVSTSKRSGLFYTITSQFRVGDEKRIDEIFNRFYAEASQAQTMKMKYAAVARCCRALLVFHFCPDANGRTISFVLFNLLMNQIGSPPAILCSPALFDGSKTTEQMVDEIEKGVTRYILTKSNVTIGEFAGKTPILDDAPDYGKLQRFYNYLFERWRQALAVKS